MLTIRSATTDELTTMRLLVEALPQPDQSSLLEQLVALEVVSDKYMNIELKTTADTARVNYKDGPLPVRGDVFEGGEQAGTVSLWVRRGKISLLSYGTHTGDMPAVFPRASEVARVRLTLL
jgi:hypothetical protein